MDKKEALNKYYNRVVQMGAPKKPFKKIWGERALQKGNKKDLREQVLQTGDPNPKKKDLREWVLLHPFSVKVSHCLLTKA